MATRLTEAELNRTTLARQQLLARSHDDVPAVVRAVGGLQAQHADMPYVGLWSRRADQVIADLESALTGKRLVKAPLMRSTLHLVRSQDWPVLDAVSAEQRLATWQPSARRAGLDLVELNAAVRGFCAEPRTVDEIEAFAAERHRGADPTAAVPGGVSRPWWRLASAGGGLVHVPPSGLWRSHAAPRYLDGRVWLADAPGVSFEERPEPDAARAAAVEHHLRAFGPASRADVARGVGILRATPLKRALALLDLRVLEGPDGGELLDLADGKTVDGDAPVPVRFLPRWDHLLVALEDRSRFLDATTTAGVYRRNGDVLPTFWTGGRVAGTWALDDAAERATLRLTPLGRAPSGDDRDALEAEGARLLAYATPDAGEPAVTWGGEAPPAARASGRARR
jgi:hypothetical protein